MRAVLAVFERGFPGIVAVEGDFTDAVGYTVAGIGIQPGTVIVQVIEPNVAMLSLPPTRDTGIAGVAVAVGRP